MCIVTVIISDGVDSSSEASRSVLSAATSLVGCGEVEVGRDVEEQTHSHTNTGGTARPLKDIKTFQNEPFLQSDELKYGTRPISMPQKPSFPVFFFLLSARVLKHLFIPPPPHLFILQLPESPLHSGPSGPFFHQLHASSSSPFIFFTRSASWSLPSLCPRLGLRFFFLSSFPTRFVS